jgi:hypothetical protein
VISACCNNATLPNLPEFFREFLPKISRICP